MSVQNSAGKLGMVYIGDMYCISSLGVPRRKFGGPLCIKTSMWWLFRRFSHKLDGALRTAGNGGMSGRIEKNILDPTKLLADDELGITKGGIITGFG